MLLSSYQGTLAASPAPTVAPRLSQIEKVGSYPYPVEEWREYVRSRTDEKTANLVMAIIFFESRGYPDAQNPTSSAYGLCQIIDGTWDAYALAHEERDSWKHQIDVCLRILDGGRGLKHWPQFYNML